ncbi:MAG: DUF115 domain-containing protein [Tolumonas sp.]|nr:DUF115 domain-containing protein [Tolumonas sp.]
MSDLFLKNIKIIKKRWPHFNIENTVDEYRFEIINGLSSTILVNGIQLSSRHDRVFEAKQQAESLPHAKTLNIYGTGLGDLFRELLLRTELLQLNVYVLNENLFILLLHLTDQVDWLTDARVNLCLASDCNEIQFPFFALPAELLLASDKNSKIRDRLMAEIEIVFINKQFQPDSSEIKKRLQSNIGTLQKDADVSLLFGLYSGRDAYVVATGPSLELHYETLHLLKKQSQHSVIICVDTALRPLMQHGIIPNFVVCIDKNISSKHFPENIPSSIELIYFPMVNNETLLSWPGVRYAAYSSSPIYKKLRSRIPKAILYSGGSVIHPAIDFAVQLGVKTITLFGADFCFSADKTHAGWEDDALSSPVATATHWVLNGMGNRAKTQPNFRSYLCELERYIARHPEIKFYNTSRIGALIDGTSFHPEFIK